MLGIIHFLSNLLLICCFLIGEKNFVKIFKIGFKSGGSSLELVQTFFVHKSKELLNFSNQIVIVFSFLKTNIHYIFVHSLESLGFDAVTFLLIVYVQPLFLNIW